MANDMLILSGKEMQVIQNELKELRGGNSNPRKNCKRGRA